MMSITDNIAVDLTGQGTRVDRVPALSGMRCGYMLLLHTASDILVIFRETGRQGGPQIPQPILPNPIMDLLAILIQYSFQCKPLNLCDSMYFNGNRKLL